MRKEHSSSKLARFFNLPSNLAETDLGYLGVSEHKTPYKRPQGIKPIISASAMRMEYLDLGVGVGP